jgi:pyruvate dehydrogenase E2 component (dihydrolipoamide acetyltransferase)
LIHDFRLPDIGEGLSEAELLSWLVEVGDTISTRATTSPLSAPTR